MGRKSPTSKQHRHGARVVRTPLGGMVRIGPEIEVQVVEVTDAKVAVSVWAPRCLLIDQTNPGNSDGQGAPTPQPSAKQSPSSTKTQE